MGNSESTKNQYCEFNEKEWKEIPLVPYTNNADPYYSSNFKVLAHQTKKYLHAEQYSLIFNSQAEYYSYLELYNTRKYASSLVNPFHIQPTTSKNMCATFHSAQLYLERIPLRLYEITDVPLSEGVYMLNSALEGFEIIMEKTGYFQVSSDLICINQQGKVKVWLNRNLSKNFPEFSKINHNKGEGEFVGKIISVIEESIDYDHCKKFSEFFYSRERQITFKKAKLMLKEYCKAERIVPDKVMKSVLIIYKGDGLNNPPMRGQNVKSKMSQNTLGRKSYDRLPNTGQQFFKNSNSTAAQTLHMSFIKRPIDFQFLEPLNFNHGQTENSKNTPVSFFYKNKNLQNFHKERTPLTVQNPQKKSFKPEKMSFHGGSRKNKNSFGYVKRKDTEDLYSSSQRPFQIMDPDIAKDLDALDF